MKKMIVRGSILVVIAWMAVIACNTKALDTLPYTATEATYFNTEHEFQQGVNGVYAKLSDFYVYNADNFLQMVSLLQGDDLTIDGGTDPFETFSFTPTDGKVNNYYMFAYQVINRANTMYEKINEEKGVYTTPGLKNKHLGEVRFLRGLMFYDLWNFYGTAPVVAGRLDDLSKVNTSNSKGTELLDSAIQDFSFAANNLPVSWPASDVGRATGNAANGFLGKALVFRATVTKNQNDYQSAISAFGKITGASLAANYTDNFSVLKENNSESLFEYQASVGLATDNVWLSNDFNGGDKSFSAYYGYFTLDPTFYGGHRYIATVKAANEFEPGDPRKALTMDTARHIQKYVGPGLDQLTGTKVSSLNNPRIFRLADVLLLQAEAIINSGGNPSDAIALINMVRARARAQSGGDGINPVARDITVTDKTTIMQWIMHERFVEFVGEETIRWFDLRRWHINGGFGIDLTKFDFSTNSNSTVNFKSYNINLPIPAAEISTNTAIKQNDGY
jgi:hypothetical protein